MAILIGLEPEMMLRLLALSLFLVPGVPGAAWGGKGHRIIASASVRGLPRVVGAWFSGQEGMVVEHASDPDHWRRDRKEPPRHFINSDVYGGPSSVPLTPDEAIDGIDYNGWVTIESDGYTEAEHSALMDRIFAGQGASA